MKGFDYQDVVLGDGMLKSSLEETMQFYLAMSNDSILKYMRQAAGLPAPGKAYTGWYTGGGMGNIGQWLSAYGRMYAISKNEAFREKAFYLCDELFRCIELTKGTDRALLTAQSFYALEKLLKAQCDLHTYCAYPKARAYAALLVDFAGKNFGTQNRFGDNSTEWYTLPEAFYHAAVLFDMKAAEEVGNRFEYREFWDLFYQDRDPFSKRPEAGLYSEFCHAYSHVNSFNSCAAAYELKKDPYYLLSLRRFYRFMKDTELMATGGFGPNFEHLMPKYRIIDALRCGHDSFETQCGSYAAFRVSEYLTRFTGEPQYSGWVESLIYNAVVATIPMTEDGKVIYYSDYNMYGAQKINRQDNWTCCTGTRPLLVAEFPRVIYFHDEDSMYVAQFTPSTVKWRRGEQTVTLTQETVFPRENSTKISLGMQEPEYFCLKLRMPEWLAGPLHVR
ncbi:MAG: glycoside hydrolase family 127 protein, partial [Parasporobacterium sp.]|nr:glycoside hydrolase family 127 protein [Parasporobacterium sp.]